MLSFSFFCSYQRQLSTLFSSRASTIDLNGMFFEWWWSLRTLVFDLGSFSTLPWFAFWCTLVTRHILIWNSLSGVWCLCVLILICVRWAPPTATNGLAVSDDYFRLSFYYLIGNLICLGWSADYYYSPLRPPQRQLLKTCWQNVVGLERKRDSKRQMFYLWPLSTLQIGCSAVCDDDKGMHVRCCCWCCCRWCFSC